MDEKKIARDELIGHHVKIKECTDPSWVGKTGKIIDETKNMFVIETKNQEKRIAKKTATFEFQVQGEKITIVGSKIAFRPENRIKKIR